MGLKSDKWIREMAHEYHMIEPFVGCQVQSKHSSNDNYVPTIFGDVNNPIISTKKIISFGVSSYGYDMRVAKEFKIFTNMHPGIVDPKNFSDSLNCVDYTGDVCIVPPNSFALARSVEYFRIPRNVMCICLGKSTYARCFSGKTRIALVDGTHPTLHELSKRSDKYYGYGVDPTTGNIVVTELSNALYVDTEEILQVQLDNGRKVYCTPDHKFMLNSSWSVPIYKEASELRVGESLRALYRRQTHDYENIFVGKGKIWLPTYRLSDNWNLLHGVYESAVDTDRHHIDHNRINNNPWNVCRMLSGEHSRLHNDEYFGESFDRDLHSERIKNGMSHLKDDPEWNKIQRQRAINFWNDPIYEDSRRKRSKNLLESFDDDRLDSISKRMKQLWEDEEYRNRMSESRKHVWTEERCVKHSEHMKQLWRDPEFRNNMILSRTKNHKVASVRSVRGKHDVYCLTSETGNFALDAGIFVHNCGIVVNITALEPEWEGHVTIEISNTMPIPAKIYAEEGISQVLFFEADEICEVSYLDKKGKYQGQTGIQLPIV